MLKSNYYHYLDADYTNDADFLFLNLCHSCNKCWTKIVKIVEIMKETAHLITKKSIHVEYFRQRNGYG